MAPLFAAAGGYPCWSSFAFVVGKRVEDAECSFDLLDRQTIFLPIGRTLADENSSERQHLHVNAEVYVHGSSVLVIEARKTVHGRDDVEAVTDATEQWRLRSRDDETANVSRRLCDRRIGESLARVRASRAKCGRYIS